MIFDQLNVKVKEAETVKMVSPKTLQIQFKGDTEPKVYDLSRQALNMLYKNLGFKQSTSEDLYKVANNIWDRLVLQSTSDLDMQFLSDDLHTTPVDGVHFALTSLAAHYVVSEEDRLILDILLTSNTEQVKELQDNIENFMLDISTDRVSNKYFGDSNNGPSKFICYPKNCNVDEDDYVPVVLYELQSKKSQYIIYTGILVRSPYTLVINPAYYCSVPSYNTFVTYSNLSSLLEISSEQSQDLYDTYIKYKSYNTEVSARELTSILSKVGYKLELKSDDEIGAIRNIYDEESNEQIQNFYNTFKFVTGESASDILQLSKLQQIFRYNKLTLLDVLSILSKEYTTPTGGKITGTILGTFTYNMQSMLSTDKEQVDQIISAQK